MTESSDKFRKFGLKNPGERPFARSQAPAWGCTLGSRGFTLLEMLVALIIGTLIVGGVMGLISVSMQHRFRLKDKRQVQPILETAAQAILADPARIADGMVAFGDFKGAPVVQVRSVRVDTGDRSSSNRGELYRVMLDYRGGRLEFSVVVPPNDRFPGSG